MGSRREKGGRQAESIKVVQQAHLRSWLWGRVSNDDPRAGDKTEQASKQQDVDDRVPVGGVAKVAKVEEAGSTTQKQPGIRERGGR